MRVEATEKAMSAAIRIPAPTALNKRRVCLFAGVALMYARPMMNKGKNKREGKEKSVTKRKERRKTKRKWKRRKRNETHKKQFFVTI